MSTTYNGTNNGYGQASKGTSLSAFITSLVSNVVIWAIEIGLFIVLRTLFKRIYEPRVVFPFVLLPIWLICIQFLETIPEEYIFAFKRARLTVEQ